MTTKLRLLSRFNAASLAANLTTTTMYNTISNGLIPNSVRSLHDQVARVNNYYSKPAKLYIETPFRVKKKSLINQGCVRGGGGCCQLKTKKTNEMKLPTCSFSLRGPTGPRPLRTRTRPPSSFVSLSRKEAINSSYRRNSAFLLCCKLVSIFSLITNLLQ